MTEDERKKAVERLKNLRAEAIDSGVDVVDAENSIEKMSIKELNLSILRQELRNTHRRCRACLFFRSTSDT